jgi:hypothetical protein
MKFLKKSTKVKLPGEVKLLGVSAVAFWKFQQALKAEHFQVTFPYSNIGWIKIVRKRKGNDGLV